MNNPLRIPPTFPEVTEAIAREHKLCRERYSHGIAAGISSTTHDRDFVRLDFLCGCGLAATLYAPVKEIISAGRSPEDGLPS